jgi:hypothetical protein
LAVTDCCSWRAWFPRFCASFSLLVDVMHKLDFSNNWYSICLRTTTHGIKSQSFQLTWRNLYLRN